MQTLTVPMSVLPSGSQAVSHIEIWRTIGPARTGGAYGGFRASLRELAWKGGGAQMARRVGPKQLPYGASITSGAPM